MVFFDGQNGVLELNHGLVRHSLALAKKKKKYSAAKRPIFFFFSMILEIAENSRKAKKIKKKIIKIGKIEEILGNLDKNNYFFLFFSLKSKAEKAFFFFARPNP